MNSWLILIPVLSALLGWTFNKLVASYTINYYLLKRKNDLASSIAARAGDILPFTKIEEKIADPILIEKAMPAIESHIDEFLSVKLPQEIPMLSMFIGDKTTGKVKEVFINQLRVLFPRVMKDMAANLKQSADIRTMVQAELEKPEWWETIRKDALLPQANRLARAGMISGLLIGLVNLLLFLLLK